MSALAERVELDPATGESMATSSRPAAVSRLGEAGQHRDQPLAQPIAGGGRPVVELGAVAQREAGQEVVGARSAACRSAAGVIAAARASNSVTSLQT